MRLLDRIEDFIFWALTAGVGAVLGGAWWLVRLIFTNQQQIEMLQQEISHRDQLRREDREDMAEVKASVKRIENVLLGERD